MSLKAGSQCNACDAGKPLRAVTPSHDRYGQAAEKQGM